MNKLDLLRKYEEFQRSRLPSPQPRGLSKNAITDTTMTSIRTPMQEKNSNLSNHLESDVEDLKVRQHPDIEAKRHHSVSKSSNSDIFSENDPHAPNLGEKMKNATNIALSKKVNAGDKRMIPPRSLSYVSTNGEPSQIKKLVDQLNREQMITESLNDKINTVKMLDSSTHSQIFKEKLAQRYQDLKHQKDDLRAKHRDASETIKRLEIQIEDLIEKRKSLTISLDKLAPKKRLVQRLMEEIRFFNQSITELKERKGRITVEINLQKHQILRESEIQFRAKCELKAMELAFTNSEFVDPEILQLKRRINHLRSLLTHSQLL